MTPRQLSNRASLDRALCSLRRDDRLDVLGEVVATAARTCATEVDKVCAVDSDEPSYARGRIIGPYLRALEGLREHVRPVETTDPWAAFLAQADTDQAAEEERARRHRDHGPDWAEVAEALSEAAPETFPLTE